LINKTLSDRNGNFELIKADTLFDAPVISVVMSVYNGRKYLCESIDSILNQTWNKFEFIIINDGSNDNTLDMLLEYQTKDGRILIVNQSNLGLTRSLNRGLNLAASGYIARQDADDISLPERLEKQFRFLEEHPQIAVLGSLGDFFNADGVLRATKVPMYSRDGIKRHLASKNLFMHGSAMMRKSHLAKVGFYREFFRHSQDYDLWLRLSQDFDIAVLPEYLYRYRVTPEAISIARWSVQKKYADLARKLHAERLAAGKDSYDTFVRLYPDGLPVGNYAADRYRYDLFLVREFVGGNQLKEARRTLRKLWQSGCKRPEMLGLFLKTLLGARLLNLCRQVRTLIFEIKV
jgi:glycosyltransferase involved in cell wall biosynthesis